MLVIGIDNGTTGSLSCIEIAPDRSLHVCASIAMPVREELDYTKQAKHIKRIDVQQLTSSLHAIIKAQTMGIQCTAFIERPMINPGRFKQSVLAARAFEATLIILEYFSIPYTIIDSREWQKVLLPKGLKGTELKYAAIHFMHKQFPSMPVSKEQDERADSMCIAYYAARHRL